MHEQNCKCDSSDPLSLWFIFWTTVNAKGFQLLKTASFLTSAPFKMLVACKQRQLKLVVVVPTNLEVVGQIHTAGR